MKFKNLEELFNVLGAVDQLRIGEEVIDSYELNEEKQKIEFRYGECDLNIPVHILLNSNVGSNCISGEFDDDEQYDDTIFFEIRLYNFSPVNISSVIQEL